MTRRMLHFLALGALLTTLEQGVERILSTPDYGPRAVIEVSAAELAALRRAHRASVGRAPAPDELDALLREHVDREILHREGLRRGLHRSDPVIRRRLAQNLRFVDGVGAERDAFAEALALGMERSDPVVRRRLVQRVELLLRETAAPAVPDDATLAAFVARHPGRFRTPARHRASQVFLSARRGQSLARDAARLHARLRAEALEPAAACALGDALPLPCGVGPASEAELARRFGADFAAAVARAEPGRWSGPVASVWGVHLVFVHERRPAALPPLADVHARAAALWREERERAALRAGLAALRARYRVRLPAGAPGAPS